MLKICVILFSATFQAMLFKLGRHMSDDLLCAIEIRILVLISLYSLNQELSAGYLLVFT